MFLCLVRRLNCLLHHRRGRRLVTLRGRGRCTLLRLLLAVAQHNINFDLHVGLSALGARVPLLCQRAR